MTSPAQTRRDYGEIAPRPPEGHVDLPALVPGIGPLELDVGFGRGGSIFSRVQAAPEARIIGVEIKAKWAYRVAERVRREELERVCIWAADIRTLLPRLHPPGTLARISVHFPDPWWKKRHSKRRVLAPDFLGEAARLLVSGGALFVQTDVEDRFADYEALLEAHPDFDVERIEDNPFGGVSNRERRAEEDGLPVHRLLAQRR